MKERDKDREKGIDRERERKKEVGREKGIMRECGRACAVKTYFENRALFTYGPPY